jgi:hypothetical protein
MTVVNGVKFTVVHGRCHLCGKKCWSMVGGRYDFKVVEDTWEYECQVCTEALRRIEIEDDYAAHLEHDINPDMAFRYPDVFRALSRRHRRVLARDLRRSVTPEVRALVVQLRAFKALGGDMLPMAA